MYDIIYGTRYVKNPRGPRFDKKNKGSGRKIPLCGLSGNLSSTDQDDFVDACIRGIEVKKPPFYKKPPLFVPIFFRPKAENVLEL